jgi:restriction system protein
MADLFAGAGGYRWLDSWVMSNIIQLGTHRFCDTFLTHRLDPTGRQYDQMTQAARSGCSNIVEGSERGATSKETEIRLTDVARASLAELSGDYVFWLLRKKMRPWKKTSDEAKAVYAVRLDKPNYETDVLYESCDHILKQQDKFSKWLDSEDDVTVANVLIILIARTINMLNRQMEAQGEKFKQEGGFREQLKEARIEEIAKRENAPVCPECGKPMRKRIAKTGKNSGKSFWGCSAYPTCNGARQLEA